MKRYFDVPDQKLVVWFEIQSGSLASVAGVEVFEKQFNAKMREIDKAEYSKLKKDYTSNTTSR